MLTLHRGQALLDGVSVRGPTELSDLLRAKRKLGQLVYPEGVTNEIVVMAGAHETLHDLPPWLLAAAAAGYSRTTYVR
jgi:hypothetical protein